MSMQQDCVRGGDETRKSVLPYGDGPEKQLKSNLKPVRLPTLFGEFYATVYEDDEGREHVGLRMGDIESDDEPVLVRIHSECLTGDVFGSVRCDCREQLTTSLMRIAEEGRGVLVYLRQEGRGIGLANKLNAYLLQDGGLDTVDANLHLGFPADGRSFAIAGAILRSLGVLRVRLLTNNPQKIQDLQDAEIEIVERVVQRISPRPENLQYLQTKAARLGHLLGDIIAGVADEIAESVRDPQNPSRECTDR